jgi:hypothetical protein
VLAASELKTFNELMAGNIPGKYLGSECRTTRATPPKLYKLLEMLPMRILYGQSSRHEK